MLSAPVYHLETVSKMGRIFYIKSRIKRINTRRRGGEKKDRRRRRVYRIEKAGREASLEVTE